MPPIRPELLNEVLKDYKKPEDLLGQDGLIQQLIKALVERALDGELTHQLGYECHDSAGDNSGNSHNGTTPKIMKGKRGQVRSMCHMTATRSSSRSSSRKGRPGLTVSTRTSSCSMPVA